MAGVGGGAGPADQTKPYICLNLPLGAGLKIASLPAYLSLFTRLKKLGGMGWGGGGEGFRQPGQKPPSPPSCTTDHHQSILVAILA
jgi:hypothetical protein